jgi:hypothetical protein
MDTPTEQHIAAYSIWCGEGEQDTGKTAELTGIPRRTIQYYMKRDGWRAQWVSENAIEADRAAAQGRQMMRHATPMVVRRLLHIVGATVPMRHALTGAVIEQDGAPVMVYAESAKDAVNAAKLLTLYALGTPLSQTDVGDSSILNAHYSVPNDTLLPPQDDGSETTAQLRARASAMLEATAQSVNTRVTSTTQRKRRM